MTTRDSFIKGLGEVQDLPGEMAGGGFEASGHRGDKVDDGRVVSKPHLSTPNPLLFRF